MLGLLNMKMRFNRFTTIIKFIRMINLEMLKSYSKRTIKIYIKFLDILLMFMIFIIEQIN